MFTKKKKSFADKFIQATELFFEQINWDLAHDHSKLDKITVEDLEYLQGYFIFNSGDNSVVHFHIREIPNWKFGIWWDEPEKIGKGRKKEYSNYIDGTFFAQYEKIINVKYKYIY